MHVLRLFFHYYIQGSFHLALMVLCCYQITHYQWGIAVSLPHLVFVFCLAFLAYNVIKQLTFLVNIKGQQIGYFGFILTLFVTMGYSIFFFVGQSFVQQLLLTVCFLFCIAYVIPLPFAKRNLRNQTGIKIFIVALCWTLITAVYPLVELPVWTPVHFLFFLERFIWIFLATLPFEIGDLEKDDHHLGTVPQLLGVRKTRVLGFLLMALMWGILLISPKGTATELVAFLGMSIAYGFAFFKTHPNSSKLITLFWVEAIPFLGVLLFQIKI